MGKSEKWRHFEEAKPLLAGQPSNLPYVDVYSKDSAKPLFYGKDITKNILKLCYKCAEFKAHHAEQRINLILATGDDVHEAQANAAQQREYAQLKAARAARRREGNLREGEEPRPGEEGGGSAGGPA